MQFNYGVSGDIPLAGRWAIPCAPGGSLGSAGLGAISAVCQLQPTPTPTAATLDQQLAAYGIVAVGNWSQADKQAMYEAALRVGGAFAIQFSGGTIDSFKRYMYRYGRHTINFIRSSANVATCTTESGVNPPTEAEITCGANNQFNVFTAVHELGHVFVGRTGGFAQGSTYYGLINIPQVTQGAGTPGILYDSSGGIVFGQVVNEWTRGRRGWGSGEATPPGTPCPYQQNPLHVTDVAVLQLTRESEVNESAADMFLNYVFHIYDRGLYTGTPSGFRDIAWATHIPCFTGTVQSVERPGQARMNYVNTIVMPTLNALITRTLTATPTP